MRSYHINGLISGFPNRVLLGRACRGTNSIIIVIVMLRACLTPPYVTRRTHNPTTLLQRLHYYCNSTTLHTVPTPAAGAMMAVMVIMAMVASMMAVMASVMAMMAMASMMAIAI